MTTPATFTDTHQHPGDDPQALHHSLAHILRALSSRRQGMTVSSIAVDTHMSRTGIGERLRAYGAVEPVSGSLTSQEQHWAITAHGTWMLARSIAICAASRPPEAAPDIVPARSHVNACMRDIYTPPPATPTRTGSARAYTLPSHGACTGAAT